MPFRPIPVFIQLLEETSTGWRFVDEDSTVENFDANGLLLDITDRFGRSQIATARLFRPSGPNRKQHRRQPRFQL